MRTTITHPFLTERGWLPLGDLGVGVKVAVPPQRCRSSVTTGFLPQSLVGHGRRVAGGSVFATAPAVVADLVVQHL